jgi:hypothetical protein
MYQTTVQNENSVRFGSGKVEVGTDINNLVNLGAMDDVLFEETWEEVSVVGGNVGEITTKIKNHQASIGGGLREVDLTKLNILRGGIDNLSTIAGVLVSGATQTVASGSWGFDKFIKFEHQNADKSAVSVNSVTGGTDGLLVADVDYFLGKNTNDEWGLYVIDSATVTTEAQSLTIDYDYTPAAATVLKSGGKTVIGARVVRITNTNEDDKIFRITIYKAKNAQGINLQLPNDDDDDSAVTPIRLTGKCDTTRTVSDQLFEIYDEQGVL